MENSANGILLVDKAEGWTSHDVVAKARNVLGTRKIGHAGTLDPMATGLLLLGVGTATRLLTHLVGLDKTYDATIRLGVTTVSDDSEGTILDTASPADIERLASEPQRIADAVVGLTGNIEQTPSAVSAIKVDGRRAYDLVRAGEQVNLKTRPVRVDAFEIERPRMIAATGLSGGSTPVDVIDVDATVRCSSGTYVRALARDLGEAVGVGGHLTALRRTEVGPFGVSNAVSTEALISGSIGREALLRPADIAAQLFPVLALTGQQEIDLGHGKRLRLDEGQVLSDGTTDAALAAAVAPSGRLVGLVDVKAGRTQVVTNFPVPAIPEAHPSHEQARTTQRSGDSESELQT